MAKIPVISNQVLRGMPAFVRQEVGDMVLRRANRAIGFDLELVEDRNCFIPHAAVTAFFDAVARAAGEANLGLLLVPMMDAADYGNFGHYVFGADTLGQAIERSIAALCYHSTHDSISVAIDGDEVRYSYVFALAGRRGYGNVACAAAGELLSLFRAFLPADWRPVRIELDVDKPRHTGLYEDVFECPVVFNAPGVAVVTERHHLTAAPRRTSSPIVTIEDVARGLFCRAPLEVFDVVLEQIRTQVLSGIVSIDRAAQSMDTSVRTLQRELNRAGTDFRSLANKARIQRATELLRHTNGSVTRVSMELGYSSPANFARAFRKSTGRAPREFRLTT